MFMVFIYELLIGTLTEHQTEQIGTVSQAYFLCQGPHVTKL